MMDYDESWPERCDNEKRNLLLGEGGNGRIMSCLESSLKQKSSCKKNVVWKFCPQNRFLNHCLQGKVDN